MKLTPLAACEPTIVSAYNVDYQLVEIYIKQTEKNSEVNFMYQSEVTRMFLVLKYFVADSSLIAFDKSLVQDQQIKSKH